MVLEFKGYYPSEVGLRKFLSTQQSEVLGCLWAMGEKGGEAGEIRNRLASEGCAHSLPTVKNVLNQLKDMAVAGCRVSSSSAARLCYHPTVDRKDATMYLVERYIMALNEAMPDAMSKAVKDLRLR
jgi:Fe2+ or Zn2+ uptake regulation protein